MPCNEKPQTSVGVSICAPAASGPLQKTAPGWARLGSKPQFGDSSILSLFSPLDQWGSWACFCHGENRIPTGQAQFKPLVTSPLLTSHWAKHDTWPNPRSADGEGRTSKSHNKQCEYREGWKIGATELNPPYSQLLGQELLHLKPWIGRIWIQSLFQEALVASGGLSKPGQESVKESRHMSGPRQCDTMWTFFISHKGLLSRILSASFHHLQAVTCLLRACVFHL